MAQPASRSRPLMLMEPNLSEIGGVGMGDVTGFLDCRFFLSFLVYCCLCFCGEYVSLPTILLVLGFFILLLIRAFCLQPTIVGCLILGGCHVLQTNSSLGLTRYCYGQALVFC